MAAFVEQIYHLPHLTIKEVSETLCGQNFHAHIQCLLCDFLGPGFEVNSVNPAFPFSNN